MVCSAHKRVKAVSGVFDRADFKAHQKIAAAIDGKVVDTSGFFSDCCDAAHFSDKRIADFAVDYDFLKF